MCSFGEAFPMLIDTDAPPSGENTTPYKARNRLSVNGLLTAYLLSFSSYDRQIRFVATETPPSGDNSSLKPDPVFLLASS